MTIDTESGSVVNNIPPGLDLVVSQGQEITAGEPLTNNPNVGGFGQKDTEIVLQSPARIQGLILFCQNSFSALLRTKLLWLVLFLDAITNITGNKLDSQTGSLNKFSLADSD